jgi:hypothetical protein
MLLMAQLSVVRYQGTYSDARGWEVIAFLNDGKTLRNTIRGIEFSGPDFDGMSPVNGSIIPALQPASWWESSMTQVEIDKDWSSSVANLVIDTLVTAKIVAKTDFERAVEIAAEEIFVRLSIGDRPSLDNVRYKSR